jgi:hypothetical protein
VTAGQVLGYVTSSTAQPYSVSSNADGTETLNTNTAAVAFLQQRLAANTALLNQKLAQRANKVSLLAAKRAEYRSLRTRKNRAARQGRRAEANRLGRLMVNLLGVISSLADQVETLNMEILALGGEIQADTEALIPPEVDTTPDEGSSSSSGSSAADAAASAAAGAQFQSDFNAALYNPLLPSTQSALGAVADSVVHSLTGSGININIAPTSADPEAIAQRVAFILGSSRIRTGGAF